MPLRPEWTGMNVSSKYAARPELGGLRLLHPNPGHGNEAGSLATTRGSHRLPPLRRRCNVAERGERAGSLHQRQVTPAHQAKQVIPVTAANRNRQAELARLGPPPRPRPNGLVAPMLLMTVLPSRGAAVIRLTQPLAVSAARATQFGQLRGATAAAKAIPVLVIALIYRCRHGLLPRDYLFLGAVSGLIFGASEVVRDFTATGPVH